MSKPTPGPWIHDNSVVYGPQKSQEFVGNEWLFEIEAAGFEGFKDKRYEEHKANVRLIAAAPELLRYLKEIIYDSSYQLEREAFELINKIEGKEK